MGQILRIGRARKQLLGSPWNALLFISVHTGMTTALQWCSRLRVEAHLHSNPLIQGAYSLSNLMLGGSSHSVSMYSKWSSITLYVILYRRHVALPWELTHRWQQAGIPRCIHSERSLIVATQCS